MGQVMISKLETLANQPQLIADVPYDNPYRASSLFLDFVRAYAASLGVTVEERTLSVRTGMLGLIFPLLGEAQTIDTGNKLVIETFFSPLSKVMIPLLNLGLTNHTFYKIHEYYHAFEALVVTDLNRRDLCPLYSTRGGFVEPPYLGHSVPDAQSLKKFERAVINKVIAALKSDSPEFAQSFKA